MRNYKANVTGLSVKRFIDFTFSVIGLIFLSPIFLILALVVKIKLGLPILFRQQRAGLNEIPFEIIKFRTMLDSRDTKGELLPDSERLTKFGRFLRSTSLDELPELWNVIRGEMSLVGPRPLPIEYLSRYSPQQLRRHEVRPGITGLAQINGRNALSWNEKFELDIWYIENKSLRLDLKILLKTIWSALKRQGVSYSGSATMPPFEGN